MKATWPRWSRRSGPSSITHNVKHKLGSHGQPANRVDQMTTIHDSGTCFPRGVKCFQVWGFEWAIKLSSSKSGPSKPVTPYDLLSTWNCIIVLYYKVPGNRVSFSSSLSITLRLKYEQINTILLCFWTQPQATRQVVKCSTTPQPKAEVDQNVSFLCLFYMTIGPNLGLQQIEKDLVSIKAWLPSCISKSKTSAALAFS